MGEQMSPNGNIPRIKPLNVPRLPQQNTYNGQPDPNVGRRPMPDDVRAHFEQQFANSGQTPQQGPNYSGQQPNRPPQQNRTAQSGNRPNMVEQKQPRESRRGIKTIGGVALALVTASAAVIAVGNPAGLRDDIISALHPDNTDYSSGNVNGVGIQPLKTLGQEGLTTQDNCELESRLVLTVSGNYVLDPLLTSSANKVPGLPKPYLSGNFKTDSGLPTATLNNIAIAEMVCVQDGGIVENQDGTIASIDRAKFSVQLEDPNGALNESVNNIWQKDSSQVSKKLMDPKLGRYMSMPYSLHINPGSDAVLAGSVKSVETALRTDKEKQVILGLMEQSAVAQISKGTYSDVSYPHGADSLAKATDNAIMETVSGKITPHTQISNNYNFVMDVAKDPKTKQYVTADVKGVSPLTGFDTTQELSITSVNVQEGIMVPLKSSGKSEAAK